MNDRRAGVYEIVNTHNGKRYVGSAVNFARRYSKHIRELAGGRHHSRILQNAWNVHGAEAFLFRPLLICARDHLLMFEQRALDVLRPEYNVCSIVGSRLGVAMTDEHKRKIGDANRGRKVTITAETRAKISAALRGRAHGPMPAETRVKVSVNRKGKGAGPRDPAIARKVSDALTGRRLSPEHCARLSQVQRGRVATDTARANMKAAQIARRERESRNG